MQLERKETSLEQIGAKTMLNECSPEGYINQIQSTSPCTLRDHVLAHVTLHVAIFSTKSIQLHQVLCVISWFFMPSY